MMRLVLVEWVDSHVSGDWISVDAARRTAAEANALTMTSVGYIVADEIDYVLLAGTLSPPTAVDEPLVNNTMQIPRCAVSRVSYLLPDRDTTT